MLLPAANPYYLYSFDGILLAEYDDSGNCVRDYIYAGTRLVAEYKPQVSAYYYYTSDQISSTRMITDGTGAAVYSVTFDPFGGVQKTWVSTYDPVLKFSGKEREPSNEMDYFGARYYAHTRYRWVSPDPVVPLEIAVSNPQGWNLYAYVRNNPLSNSDPAGLYTFENGTPEQQKAFNNALKIARSIDDVKNAVASYGQEGEENGVRIKFESGEPITRSHLEPELTAASVVSFDPNIAGDDLIIDIAHEGSHVADYQKYAKELCRISKSDSQGLSVLGTDQFDPTTYDAEVRAYNISAKAAMGLGIYKLEYGRHIIMKNREINSRGLNAMLSEKYQVSPESRGRRLSGRY